MNESSLTPAKVVSIALHVFGACFALAHLIAMLLSAATLAALFQKAPGGGGASWALPVLIGLFSAVGIQLTFSALAILVRNSARTADATERLAETVQRLDLSQTTDGGLYYRIR
ncbi:MAG TPA: hypothetical protein VK178_18795 [Opitutaceae bacterium]|nr:hypothetical protein [Opitutaceae bacterium]